MDRFRCLNKLNSNSLFTQGHEKTATKFVTDLFSLWSLGLN